MHVLLHVCLMSVWRRSKIWPEVMLRYYHRNILDIFIWFWYIYLFIYSTPLITQYFFMYLLMFVFIFGKLGSLMKVWFPLFWKKHSWSFRAFRKFRVLLIRMVPYHSSQSLCLKKCSSEMLSNLPYFYFTNVEILQGKIIKLHKMKKELCFS